MDFLKQPYPYFHKGKQLMINVLLIFVLVFFFEYFLQPFERTPAEYRQPFWVIALVHATNPAVVYLLFFWLSSRFVNEDDWKLYKEAGLIAIFFFLAGSGSFAVREIIYDNPNNVSWRYFFEEVRNAYLVGSVLMFMIISINFQRLRKKNERMARQMVLTREEMQNHPKIQINANVEADHFELAPTDVLCIKSDGNYLEFFLKDQEPVRLIKRLTLQSAAEQLAEFNFIIKTHRAFLVNVNQVEEVAGNAQGYQLKVRHLDFPIPVSRSHIKAFDRFI